jgi:shikimate dehydrogenase
VARALESIYDNRVKIDGSTKIVGVYGSPIAHTASPAMHNAAFDALGMNWAYLAFHVDPRNLGSALTGARDMGFGGVNLTVPHKVLALEIVDEVDAEARKLGAVNTVVLHENHTVGFNTDGYGITHGLQEDFNLSVAGKKVLVLGAGGAGRAIAVQCGLNGASKIGLANRTPERLKPVIRELTAMKIPFQAWSLDPETIRAALEEFEVVINATSVGLQSGESLGLRSEFFTNHHYVYDTIYRPAETQLLRAARSAGASVANGLSMLLHQGVKAFEIWTGQTAPVAVMRRALRAAVGGDKS